MIAYKAKQNKKGILRKHTKTAWCYREPRYYTKVPFSRTAYYTLTSKNKYKVLHLFVYRKYKYIQRRRRRWQRTGTLVNIHFANVFIKFIYITVSTFICSQQTRLELLYRMEKSRYRFLFCVPGRWHGSFFHFSFNIIQMRANPDIIYQQYFWKEFKNVAWTKK